MKVSLAIILSVLAYIILPAQTRRFDIDLWPAGLPNHNGLDTLAYDMEHNYKPMIRVFLPDSAVSNGRAVVVCPGGGYYMLSVKSEGDDWAQIFNDLGYAFVTLHYRMPEGNRDVPVADALEAMRLVKEHAPQWGIDPAQVGIMGFSAGGHLASTVATHAPAELRPAFQILFYPVVTMDKALTHLGSHDGLLGSDASPELEAEYSAEKNVTENTPPAIFLCSDDDTVVPVMNSVQYYAAMKRHGIPATLHIYPSGGHGWGSNAGFRYRDAMLRDLTDWLSF